MQRELKGHQKVVVEVDFSGGIWGYTEITIVPTHKDLRTVHLHSRQCTIHSVTVGPHKADFVQYDPFVNLNISNSQDCHSHPELKRRVYGAYAEGEEGELSIAIPKEVSVKYTGAVASNGIVGDVGATEPPTRAGSLAPGQATEFAPLVIHIDYSLRNPVDGLEFILPTDAYPHRVPHAYTTPSSPDSARCWVPCLDSIWDKCTWEFEFVVPRYLEEREPREEEEEAQSSYPTVVVCSGELVEQVAHPYNSSKSIFLFSQPIGTSVQHIAWAAGPFHVYPVPAEHFDEASGTQPLMHAFCLPGHEPQLISSVSFMRSAMNFYLAELGSYPSSSYKLVFVDELPAQRFDSATLSLVTVDLLHGEDAIDQVYETRLSLSHALACQWVGINIQPKTNSDTWLTNGLGLYVTGLFYRKTFGLNEYRYRMKKDMDRVVEWDRGSMPPICQPQVLDPPDPSVLPFINLKAPLVLHILDRRLCKSGTSLGLSRVLPKIFLSAISGELVNNALSTHAFLRMCRKVSGMDPRSFAEQWIYGSGCPAFSFSASFNRKKMAVEILMRQDAPAFRVHESHDIGKVLMKPVPFFEGQMTIRIHEADGTPYEHVLDIRTPFKRFEVPFNTKYKRVRRNTKRYLARQAAAQAVAEGEVGETQPGPGELVDVGFGVDIWENDHERENWKIAEWSEADEQTMSGATYEWIRLDADLEWVSSITFEQPDFMWVSQLQRDRDVVAQMEAVHALGRMPTAIVSSVLTKTVLVNKYFYRIRCEAAKVLAKCAVPKLDYLGLFHLFKLFLRYCYDPEDPHQDLFSHTYVPRSNDFSDLPEYFVRKALLIGLSHVRFDTGKTPTIIRQFLIDQLRYNDNTSNPYSDAFYICTIISALACATVPTKPPERSELGTTEVKSDQNAEDLKLLQQAFGEVDRYRAMDRLIPSHHNVVTVAAIDFYVVLSTADLIPSDQRLYFPLTREGNYTQVRMAAFDALFLTKWYTPKIMRYFLAVIAHDASRVIRRHVARNACHSLAILFSMGELKASAKETDTLLIEEDGAMADKAKEAVKKSEVDLMIKALRKDREVGKNDAMREFLMPIALAPDVDHEVRWCLLKFADILVRGADEAPPKVTIHLPPTPVLEQPPQLPVKMPLKHRPSLKIEDSIRSPLTPYLGTPKLKLPPSALGSGGHTSKPPLTPVITVAPPRPQKNAPTKVKHGAVSHPPKPQPKPVHKPPPTGLSRVELKCCQNMLKKLQSSKHALLFLQPVDPVRDKAPNYFAVIKNPMDLSTIGAKLQANLYPNLIAFEADFRLMVDNCKLYNADGTYAFNEAISLQQFFDRQWERIKKTLDQASQSYAAAKPVVVESMPPPPAPVPMPATPTTARPVIKLKVGNSQQKPLELTRASPAPTPPKPLKQRRSKPSGRTRPPEIDDGTADLFAEVDAMENQKAGGPPRRPVPSVKLSVGKRKRTPASVEEDEVEEFLAESTPSKKERPSPPEVPGPPADETPAPRPKLVVNLSHKAKRLEKSASPAPASVPGPSTAPAPAQIAPRVTLKGKDREATSSSPAPAVAAPRVKHSSAPERAPINEKKCKEVLKTLIKLPEALIFLRPVDPVADGCPTYYDEIKNPMDFGTMQTKLSQGKYETMEDFASDVRLVLNNCRKFNPPTTYPTDCADALERMFQREWTKATERKLSPTEKRSLLSVLNKTWSVQEAWIFHTAVDPVALNIPHYHDIIPKQRARDLSLIKKKLEGDKYESVQAFEADIDLMIDNAMTFNGDDSEIGKMAFRVRNSFKDALANAAANLGKKRKDGGTEKGGPQPTVKKLKLK